MYYDQNTAKACFFITKPRFLSANDLIGKSIVVSSQQYIGKDTKNLYLYYMKNVEQVIEVPMGYIVVGVIIEVEVKREHGNLVICDIDDLLPNEGDRIVQKLGCIDGEDPNPLFGLMQFSGNLISFEGVDNPKELAMEFDVR